MLSTADLTATDPPRVLPTGTKTERAWLALSSLAVWGHTIDEVRIGEFIAVPAAIATAALLAFWTRAGATTRGIFGVLLGLVWVSGAIPYHLVPLLQGATTWQNVSGLQQLLGGLGVLVLGARALYMRRHRKQSPVQ